MAALVADQPHPADIDPLLIPVAEWRPWPVEPA